MASLNRPAAAAAPAELSSGLIGNTPDVGKPVFAHFEISKATGTCHCSKHQAARSPSGSAPQERWPSTCCDMLRDAFHMLVCVPRVA